MEPNDLDLILRYLGPGAGPLIGIVWIALRYKPIYDRHVKALERDIILKKHQLKVLAAHGEFLKGQGHVIETPELIESL